MTRLTKMKVHLMMRSDKQFWQMKVAFMNKNKPDFYIQLKTHLK